ncbi:hypothetical protein EX30DRAFT_373115 [Ascodesmis nigricans]|uniref:histidine kinase n=1 Tax=Ascodesmis nigricans TaxID=341454 RepID=A0A4S2MQA4_9PEZI|nr:hypothetical protein EX30DRAFT_373115 [Ascodesmis nigricans]
MLGTEPPHTPAAPVDHPAASTPDTAFPRSSICVGSQAGVILSDHPLHTSVVSQLFSSPESKLLEATIHLKSRLRDSPTFEFWQILAEGLATAAGAQYAFVSKRLGEGDDVDGVPTPEFGAPGSRSKGIVFFYTGNRAKLQPPGLSRDYLYPVYGCACQWMKNDRVLLIPERLPELTPENPNVKNFPEPAEAYMAVPLMNAGKCYGHFGVMFTKEGLQRRRVGWGMLEMLLHSLEELVGEKALDVPTSRGKKKGRNASAPAAMGHSHSGMKISTGCGGELRPSLRPYARRLSHELRTPMQGVVGMLDIMYASVMEATVPSRPGEWPDLKKLREVIDGLRSSIEVAQDSSKRAVDAADNMVYGYDFNMEIPRTPGIDNEMMMSTPGGEYCYGQLAEDEMSEGSPRKSMKRRRASSNPNIPIPPKVAHIEIGQSPSPVPSSDQDSGYFSLPSNKGSTGTTPGVIDTQKFHLTSTPVRFRQTLHEAVHHSIRSGGRPDVTKATPTPHGELITVETADATPNTPRSVTEIEVHVDDGVPETIIVDASALGRLISSVFHNAFKYTPEGRITLTVTPCVPTPPTTLSPTSTDPPIPRSCIEFSIIDTGFGIPAEFLPSLFHPFSRPDASLTQHRDGLGLGLMVGKSIARKMGGDLWCERTATSGPNRGSEFRIRLPVAPLIESPPSPSEPVTPRPISPDPFRKPSVSNPLRATLSPPPPPQPTSHPRPQPRRSRTSSNLPYDPDQGRKHPLRILVVEDNRINRSLLVSMLKKLGYDNVLEARDGVEAVEVFQEQMNAQGGVDLVLMDLWMPRMDGFSATKRIRECVEIRKNELDTDADNEDGMNDDDHTGNSTSTGAAAGGATEEQSPQQQKVKLKEVTVLAVSADATEMAKEKAREVGIGGFVEKPFGIRELGEAVGRV